CARATVVSHYFDYW
nr:immunoglobulin heavy chain junction region [Mus musculus]MBK4196230.1 immunoglobulin heavy chain junction region [Mus musculus]